ncbi:MAG: hypothetical protein FWE88_00915 [Phycisphaerae bacterium]|nr:hypothetical protein [Phycisphaerae bacterium]
MSRNPYTQAAGLVLILLLLGILVYFVRFNSPDVTDPARGGKATVVQRVEQYGAAARGRLAGPFRQAGLDYPPKEVLFVGIKDTAKLEVWGRAATDQPFRWIVTYPILGASGTLGPKLREGDRQVPEGIYDVESLNPNSRFHLSLRVSYPNAFDRRMGTADGRRNLGGDIMIHGGTASIGCLAMGDDVAEELFILAADTGIKNCSIILTPVDFRVRDLPATMPPTPEWTNTLYQTIRQNLAELPPAPQ